MKSGKRFIGCSSYPDCKTGFPLPQTGLIEPLKQNCARCGKPMIVVRREGRVFRNCIDMNCKSPAKLAAEAAKAEEAAKTAGTADVKAELENPRFSNSVNLQGLPNEQLTTENPIKVEKKKRKSKKSKEE